MPLMKSIRQQVMEAVRARLVDIASNVSTDPDADPSTYPFSFTLVELGPLSDTAMTKRYSVGIIPGREQKVTRYPIVDVTLPVNIEFQMLRNQGDAEPGIEAEKILTVIQRAIMSDRTLGGLVIDMRETGNEVDLLEFDDKSIMGVVMWSIQYRHSVDDPRSAILG